MTTKTTRHPRRVTSNTSHICIAVGQLIIVLRRLTPAGIVFENRLGVARFLAVVASARGDRVNRLRDAPPAPRNDQRVLNDVAGLEIEIFAVLAFLLPIARDALKYRHLGSAFVARGKAACEIPPDYWSLSCLGRSHPRRRA